MVSQTKKYLIRIVYILIDVVCIIAAIFIACLVLNIKLPYDITFYNLFLNPENKFRFVFLFWIVVTVVLNKSNDLYQTKRELYEPIEVWQVIKSCFISSIITIMAIYLVKIEGFPRTVFGMIAVMMMIFLSIWRVLKRMFVDYLVTQGYNNFNVLIIGAGRIAQSLAHEIENRQGLGLNIVGFLDDKTRYKSEKIKSKIIGKILDFPKIAREEFIHEIFIAAHLDEDTLHKILEHARGLGIAIRVIPYGYEFMSAQFTKFNIGLIPVLEYSESIIIRKQAGKRIFDFIMGLVGFFALLPLFIMVAVLIKLDSPGPIFHVSKRYGRRGHIFKMLKFRSMVDGAEKSLNELKEKNEADGPIFKIKKDPRITKCGRILRKFSFDELPQILNVIRGDMSFVGPRPLLIEQIQKEDFRQLQRLEVRPGITGLWQIRGRSDISFARLLRWDVWYIKNWSFWLDISILLKTVPVVVKGKGAY